MTYAQEHHDWEDESIFGINKLKPHTSFFAVETEELLNKTPESSQFIQNLNGSWKFNYDALYLNEAEAGDNLTAGEITVGANKHGSQILIGEQTTLIISHKQMGVGGDNSWGAMPHNQYLLNDLNYNFSFIVYTKNLNN
jgi:hypothetical protein